MNTNATGMDAGSRAGLEGAASRLSAFIKQHLIDRETCMRRSTCESACPTGAIDTWRMMPLGVAYRVQSQPGWNSLPDEMTPGELAAEGISASRAPAVGRVAPAPAAGGAAGTDGMRYGTTLPPWSAAHACTNLYDASNPGIATVPGKMRVTAVGREFDTHHIVLDPRGTPFPVLAVSHAAGKPKHYVHDLMRARADDLALQLADDDAYFYVCGLKAMEEGVVPALRGIATGAGLNWETVGAALKRDGRLHLETY